VAKSKPIYKELRRVVLEDGTIEKRESKWWYIRWTDASGKRKKKKAAPTHAQAKEVLTAKLAEVAAVKAGLPICNANEISLDDLLDRYLAARKPHITPKHLGEIESELNRAFTDIKAWRVGDVSREKIEQYLNRRADSGLSPRTINNTLGHFKAIFNWAVKIGELPANPIACVSARPQYEKRRKRRALSDDETRRLIGAMDKGWLKIGAMLALYCGLRVSDIRRLKWSDIDLECNEISLRPEAEKNRKGSSLPIHPVLRNNLVTWRKESLPGPGALVVKLPHKPVTRLKRALKKAKIPYKDDSDRYVDWHSLRHSFLTNLAKAGTGVKELQGLGRHSDPKLTFGIYVHSSKEREARAVAKLPDYTSDTSEESDEIAKEGTNDLPIASPSANRAQQMRSCSQVATAKRDIKESRPVLNQRVPGSSPGGGTKTLISAARIVLVLRCLFLGV